MISLEEYITATMAKVDKKCSRTGADPECCTDEAKARKQQRFEAIFNDADKDGSGLVDQKELKDAVKAHLAAASKKKKADEEEEEKVE